MFVDTAIEVDDCIIHYALRVVLEKTPNVYWELNCWAKMKKPQCDFDLTPFW